MLRVLLTPQHVLTVERYRLSMATSKYTPKDIERFWSKVAITADIEQCWEWTACLFTSGYGQFAHGGRMGRMLKAHRVSFELTTKVIPDGLCVLHKCDNRKCVNPNHLFLGTISENNRDTIAKGRVNHKGQNAARGEQHYKHKLTDDKIRYIRRRFLEGDITKAEIGHAIGVDEKTIEDILKGKTWKHVF